MVSAAVREQTSQIEDAKVPKQNPVKKRARPGAKRDVETAKRVAEIVARVVGDQRWNSMVDDICDALDEANVPRPKTWRSREPRIMSWSDAAATAPELAKKAINHHLKNANA
jgi:hypothetical protein